MQEFVYNSLSASYRELFTEIDLSDEALIEKDFQMMYDNEAQVHLFSRAAVDGFSVIQFRYLP